MANQCAVHRCGRDLWVKTAPTHLPCSDLNRKTTPNKQRAVKPYKKAMNWAQIAQKKQQQAQVYESKIYLCLYFYVLTDILNFSYKFFKSFVICKTVSKLAVIYAPSLGHLCSHLPCFALRRKTTPNKQRAVNRIKRPWIEPRSHRKGNNRPKFTKVQFISIFMAVFLQL